jgi:cell division GTPase FtsZ
MTKQQIQLIHIAAKQVGLDDERYRLLLRNVACALTSKQLSNDSFEEVMAVLEGMGFRTIGFAPDYWRQTVAKKGITCGRRMAHKIRELAATTCYPAESMALRHSHGATSVVEQLSPLEAYEVIEAYKQIAKRPARSPAGAGTREEAARAAQG